MDSEQLPTPESEDPKPVDRKADDDVPKATDNQKLPPKEQPSILYRVRWVDARDESRKQEFVSEVPIGPLEVTTKSYDGTTLVGSRSGSLPAIEVITRIVGNAPGTSLVDDTAADASDDSDASDRGISVYNGRRTRTKPYGVPMPPGSDAEPAVVEPAVVRPTKRSYAPVTFEDLTITDVINTRIAINSKDLLESIRGVMKYYPPDRFSGDSVELREPYRVLVHHLDELEELQGRLGQEFDATYKIIKSR